MLKSHKLGIQYLKLLKFSDLIFLHGRNFMKAYSRGGKPFAYHMRQFLSLEIIIY